jgi:hypothetical protein
MHRAHTIGLPILFALKSISYSNFFSLDFVLVVSVLAELCFSYVVVVSI